MSSQHAQTKREMPIAGVVRLIDLMNYQEGAVVSRTLVKFIENYKTIGQGQGGWREDYQYFSQEAGI